MLNSSLPELLLDELPSFALMSCSKLLELAFLLQPVVKISEIMSAQS